MRFYFVSFVVLCILTLGASGQSSVVETTTSTSTPSTTKSAYWEDLLGNAGHGYASGRSSFQRDYFHLKDMCPVNQVRYSTEKCAELGGVDWIIGAETSWFSGDTYCEKEDTESAYEQMVVLIRDLLKEMNKTLDMSDGHRLGIYFTDRKLQVIQNLCKNRPQLFGNIEFPTIGQLDLNQKWEDEYTYLNLGKQIDQEIKGCSRPAGKPIIMFLFTQKLTVETFWKPRVQEFFKLLDEWKGKKIPIYLITVNHCGRSILNTGSGEKFPQYRSLLGRMFINSYNQLWRYIMPTAAKMIFRCSCRRGYDCKTKQKVTATCHFEVKGKEELCQQSVELEILHQPDDVICNTSRTLPCTIEQCMKDCDLKGWLSWTTWQLSGDIRLKQYQRSRRRLRPEAGSSAFTKNCKSEEKQFCTGDDCRSSSGHRRQQPVPSGGITTTDDDVVTGEIETRAWTKATKITTLRTTTFNTTSVPPQFNLFGLNLTVLVAIGAGGVLVLAIICCGVCMVLSSRRKPAQVKIVFRGGDKPQPSSQQSFYNRNSGSPQRTSSWSPSAWMAAGRSPSSWMRRSPSPQSSQMVRQTWTKGGRGRSVGVLVGSLPTQQQQRPPGRYVTAVGSPSLPAKSKFGRGTYLQPSYGPGQNTSQNQPQQIRPSGNSRSPPPTHKPYRTLKAKPQGSRVGSQFDEAGY